MKRKPVQFGLSTLLAGITFSAIVFAWATISGGTNAVLGCLALILFACVGGILLLIGVRAFGSSLSAGSIFVLFVIFLDDIMPDKESFLLCVCVSVLWGSWAYFIGIRGKLWNSLQTAVGLTWGFLIGTSLFVSIQNGSDSVNWPTMIPGLLLIPLLFFVPLLPYWGIRHFWELKRGAKKGEGRVY
jgi:hypothetical protein